MPIPRAMASLGSAICTGCPSSRISPSSGRDSPKRMFISVVLPAPFSPRSAWISPALTSRLIPLLATTPGKRLVIPRISSRGGGDCMVLMVSLLDLCTSEKRGGLLCWPPLFEDAGGMLRSSSGRLERTTCHRGCGVIKFFLDIRSDQAGEIVIRGESNGGRRGGCIVAHGARNEGAGCGTLSDRLNCILKLLLGAGDDALRQVRESLHLVDIYADAVNAGIAGGFKNALACQAGDLEQHICTLPDELLGNGFTGRRI